MPKPPAPPTQHHFVLFGWEDSDGNIHWIFDSDQEAYLPDGNVWIEGDERWVHFWENRDIQERDKRLAKDLIELISKEESNGDS